ncbi:MAG: uncharacterized protein KVP18_003091 [Porospora cf. gigantea A]|uniref:uncharacterized protein n=1 Tax=Porospora cf. gigantea A TaxID=2853593 RepID=UPI00355ABD7C|nr:MAG: hypothetical protein KVP18_003091 [Porospora cf. gigantea A]
MVIGVLQGTHKRPVQLPSSTNSIGTDPNLSQRAKDAGIKLHDTTFYDAMCRVDAELGRRILDNLDSVFRATDAYSMLAAVVAFLQNVTTQDTLDMGTEAWEKTTRSLLRVLWETLRAQNRYTSQTRPASGAERIQHVESALNRQANLFREPAIARTVKRAARRFPQPSAAMDGPELLLRVVSDGLSQVDPPLSSVNMSTWSARRAGPHRVLLTIADGRQFPTLNRLVLTIRRAAGDSDHQRIRNLLGIAQLPLSVVWAIGRQAFEELLDLAMRTEISPSRSPAVVVPDAVWRAPIRVKRIGAAAVDQDESAVGQGDECVVCAEAWSQHELAALDDYCQQFKTKSDPVTSPSVRRLNLLRSGLDANYCGHFFHKKCMSEWGGTCPLCRAHWISTPS